MLGLRPGRRYLYLGVPLLQGFTVSQLCAVLAHELGHYSHSHTRLGALNYRGRMTIVRTIQEIGPSSIAGWILRAYARLYFHVESAVSRRQELEADQAAVRIAGRGTAIGMMRELHVVDQMWHFYLNNYVGWGWEAGSAPPRGWPTGTAVTWSPCWTCWPPAAPTSWRGRPTRTTGPTMPARRW